MKNKSTLLISILILFLSSCAKQPNCDDTESIELAKQLIVQQMKEEIGTQYKMIGLDFDNFLKKFIDKNVEVINIRPTAKYENLRKCDCSSQISFKYPDDFIKKIEELESKSFMKGVITTKLSNKLNYDYTLQIINKNEELFIDGILPTKEINEVFSMYLTATIEFGKTHTNEEENIVYEEEKNHEKYEDTIINNNTNNNENEVLLQSSEQEIKHQEDINTAIGMLKQNKSTIEILKATSLLRPEISELRAKLREE